MANTQMHPSTKDAPLVLIDWRHQESVYGQAPVLTEFSMQTLRETTRRKIIDVTERSLETHLTDKRTSRTKENHHALS